MTESEWLNATDPKAMLAFLRDSGRASDRKLRLFAVACCRRMWHLFSDRRAWKAVEFAERLADGLATTRQLKDSAWGRAAEGACVVRWKAWEAAEDAAEYGAGKIATAVAARDKEASEAWAGTFWEAVRRGDPISDAFTAADAVAPAAWVGKRDSANRQERQCQADVLRDLFGPLAFRKIRIDPAWNDGTVRRMAEAAYGARLLPSGELDRARLAVLADALEEAGCHGAGLLGHLRSEGPHVRGCWALDLLLLAEGVACPYHPPQVRYRKERGSLAARM